jgi:hypothetical protein
MRAASIGALAAHSPFPIDRRSWIVYPNPVPIACGTAAAFVIKAWLVATSEANDWRADPRAVDSGVMRF